MKTAIYWASLVLCSVLFAAVAMGDEPQKFEPSDQQVLLHAEAQRHRLANGRDSQELDAECCRIAQAWAETMAARRSMFHGGGEQIVAYGYSTPAAAMRVWIASGGHNTWLLSSTRRAGWGAAQSSGGTWYWAGAFRGAVASTTSGTTYSNPRRGWFRWRR
jgi:hypothetical protein